MTDSILTLQDPDQIKITLVSPTALITTISVTDSTLILPTAVSLQSKIETSQIKSVLANAQGPAGPAGASAEDEVKSEKRIDFVGDTVIYKGEAVPGTSDSASVWQISKTTFVGDDVIVSWANGTANSDKVWNNRETYNYPT